MLTDNISMLLDPQFKPNAKKIKRSILRKKIQNAKLKAFNSKTNRWDDDQNQKYVNFLSKNKMIFEIKDSIKKNRIFTKMALILKSRKAAQCRSHHQKMIQRYGNIENIISQLLNSHSMDQQHQETPQGSVKQKEKIVHEISINHQQQSQEKKPQIIEFQSISVDQNIQEDIYQVLDI